MKKEQKMFTEKLDKHLKKEVKKQRKKTLRLKKEENLQKLKRILKILKNR